MRLATSGRRIATSGLTSTWLAHDVRDFVIAASPSWTARTAKLGSIVVRVYAFPSGNGSRLMTLALRALRRYQALMGPYPYPTFVVAESGGGYGMEAPGLIWIPRGLATGRLPGLVSHEVAHQWFVRPRRQRPGTGTVRRRARWPTSSRRFITGTGRSSRCATDTLDRSIHRYSASCYFEVVYVQGGRVLDGLRRRMGSTAFWAGIRDYLDREPIRRSGGTRLPPETRRAAHAARPAGTPATQVPDVL